MRWFPTVFRESSRSNGSGDDVPWFSLSEDALSLRHEELQSHVGLGWGARIPRNIVWIGEK
ncbi:hypothetical protein Cni_G04644 [Canna indica]|uniref:Uncharacterized protein n=1 Tax=Canna indica TaxID=4628 RepID=A0AAQ3JTU4_9LILI|nr:hypothetical protein Cni_G04644 [Canna indica]